MSGPSETTASFISLPSELRNIIYELVLLRDEPIDPCWLCFSEALTPGLFRVNKAIHREASSLFYGNNCFDLSGVAAEIVILFLKQIGNNNAAYIRHVIIDFPGFSHADPGDVTLEGSVTILEYFQSRCTSLTSLTTSLHSTNAMELTLDGLDNHKVATEALELIDTHFRAISPLQDIILEVYEDGPSGYIRQRMKSLGWTVSIADYVDDWGRSFSDYDDDDYSFGYGGESDDYDDDDDGGGDNDYDDYDNDSDFWRRAAD
ncbi:hypothetical protein F5Y12DRAFT_714793 [Xylaria sp. FL1777]|nr:hypothetical protein F5Y12DRAFT_714793 [Xylaria sp. FL1777]